MTQCPPKRNESNEIWVGGGSNFVLVIFTRLQITSKKLNLFDDLRPIVLLCGLTVIHHISIYTYLLLCSYSTERRNALHFTLCVSYLLDRSHRFLPYAITTHLWFSISLLRHCPQNFGNNSNAKNTLSFFIKIEFETVTVQDKLETMLFFTDESNPRELPLGILIGQNQSNGQFVEICSKNWLLYLKIETLFLPKSETHQSPDKIEITHAMNNHWLLKKVSSYYYLGRQNPTISFPPLPRGIEHARP